MKIEWKNWKNFDDKKISVFIWNNIIYPLHITEIVKGGRKNWKLLQNVVLRLIMVELLFSENFDKKCGVVGGEKLHFLNFIGWFDHDASLRR